MPDEVIDRRATIEAALEQQETAELEPGAAPVQAPAPPSDPAPSEPKTEAAAAPGEAAQRVTAPAPSPEPAEFPVDKAPQSWRAPQRAKWEKLDPDIRQEVMRRERETTKVLGETAQARQFSNNFQQAIQPYQARLTSLGVSPINAVSDLLKADYILSTAPKVQRAQAMAQLIKEYDIDILELDSALTGGGPANPVDAKFEEMLAKRLAPLQQFLAQHQQREQAQEQQSMKQVSQTVEQMAGDAKYPHFEAVRMDMADAIDLAAKRGLYLSLDQAYNRAVAMNPEVSAQVAAQQAIDAKKSAAQAAHARAQKALGASVSVGGAPGGAPSGASGAIDRRAAIAAAFDSVGGG